MESDSSVFSPWNPPQQDLLGTKRQAKTISSVLQPSLLSQPEMKARIPVFGQGEQYTTIHEQYIGVLSFSVKITGDARAGLSYTYPVDSFLFRPLNHLDGG